MDFQNPHSKSFYKNEENARNYIESTIGFDGRFLIEILKKHLKPNSTVLELGMGAGKDLDILNETFKATGSDYSQAFLNIYKKKTQNADLLLINAKTLKTNRKFDCIYSNKVLHHLTKEDLKNSLKKQKNLLNSKGLLFHTFWRGVKEETFQDLKFIHYTISQLKEIVEKDYELIEIDTYEEMNKNDSIYLIAKNKI